MGGSCSRSTQASQPVVMGKRTMKVMGLDAVDRAELEVCFATIDADGDESITYDELLGHIGGKHSDVFMRRVFDVFGDRETQQISLLNFQNACWTYCTLDRSALVRFAFDLYDTDGTGKVIPQDVLHMLQDAYGRKFERSRYTLSLKKKLTAWQKIVTREGNGEGIRFADFKIFADANQSILFPAAHIQKLMRKKFLGERYWSKAMSDRREVLKMEGKSKKRIAKVTAMQSSVRLNEQDKKYEEAFDQLTSDIEKDGAGKRNRNQKQKSVGELRQDYIGDRQNNKKYQLQEIKRKDDDRRKEAKVRGLKYRPEREREGREGSKQCPTNAHQEDRPPTAKEVAAAAAAFDKQIARREKHKQKTRDKEREWEASAGEGEDSGSSTVGIGAGDSSRMRLHSVGTSNPSLQQFAQAQSSQSSINTSAASTAGTLSAANASTSISTSTRGRQRRYMSADAIPNMRATKPRSRRKIFASDDCDISIAADCESGEAKAKALQAGELGVGKKGGGRRRSISLNIKKKKTQKVKVKGKGKVRAVEAKDITSTVMMVPGQGTLAKSGAKANVNANMAPKTKQQRDEERQKRLTKTVKLDDI